MGCILGIDPGVTGALALYDIADIGSIQVWDIPVIGSEVDVHALANIVRGLPRISAAYIENVGPMPHDGVRQCWRFSAANTAIRTVIVLTGIPLVPVPSTTWKKVFALRGEAKSKPRARQKAIQLFPQQASRFSRVKDGGRAEAALIAVFGARETFHSELMLKQVAVAVGEEPVKPASELFAEPCTFEQVADQIALPLSGPLPVQPATPPPLPPRSPVKAHSRRARTRV